jgi:hypothetical protein
MTLPLPLIPEMTDPAHRGTFMQLIYKLLGNRTARLLNGELLFSRIPEGK